MTAMPAATGHQALIQNPARFRPADCRRWLARMAAPSGLLDMVVRRFARDDDVVHVALAQSGAGDAHKPRLLLQFANCSAAEIAHAGAQSADELVDHGLERPAIRHAAFNALGHKLGQAVLVGALALHYAFGAFRVG